MSPLSKSRWRISRTTRLWRSSVVRMKSSFEISRRGSIALNSALIPSANSSGETPLARAVCWTAAIDMLPAVVAACGETPVLFDSGVRSGTDIVKALALGARAIGIGRPMLWGLGAFGEAGVDRVLEIMQGELKLVMGNCGTQSVADINRAYVSSPDWKL